MSKAAGHEMAGVGRAVRDTEGAGWHPNTGVPSSLVGSRLQWTRCSRPRGPPPSPGLGVLLPLRSPSGLRVPLGSPWACLSVC